MKQEQVREIIGRQTPEARSWMQQALKINPGRLEAWLKDRGELDADELEKATDWAAGRYGMSATTGGMVRIDSNQPATVALPGRPPRQSLPVVDYGNPADGVMADRRPMVLQPATRRFADLPNPEQAKIAAAKKADQELATKTDKPKRNSIVQQLMTFGRG